MIHKLRADATQSSLGTDPFNKTEPRGMRASAETRVEESALLCDLVKNSIRSEVPVQKIDSISDNIGLPFSSTNLLHSISCTVGVSDSDILATLRSKHHPTSDYVRDLRRRIAAEFPCVVFYTIPTDMTSQVLNFGLPAPIDVQIEGNDLADNRAAANQIMARLQHVPGLTDSHIQQPFGNPKLHVAIDRTKAAEPGSTVRDLAGSILCSLSGSMQVTPLFFLNRENGVDYSFVTQTHQYKIQSLKDTQNIPISSSSVTRPEILADLATMDRSSELQATSYYNIRHVLDIFGAVQDLDLGSRSIDGGDSLRRQPPPRCLRRRRGRLRCVGSLRPPDSALGLPAGGGEPRRVAHS